MKAKKTNDINSWMDKELSNSTAKKLHLGMMILYMLAMIYLPSVLLKFVPIIKKGSNMSAVIIGFLICTIVIIITEVYFFIKLKEYYREFKNLKS